MTEIKRVTLLMLLRKLPSDSIQEIYIRPICEALDPYSAKQTGAAHFHAKDPLLWKII